MAPPGVQPTHARANSASYPQWDPLTHQHVAHGAAQRPAYTHRANSASYPQWDPLTHQHVAHGAAQRPAYTRMGQLSLLPSVGPAHAPARSTWRLPASSLVVQHTNCLEQSADTSACVLSDDIGRQQLVRSQTEDGFVCAQARS